MKDSLRLRKRLQPIVNLPTVQGPSSTTVRDIDSGDNLHDGETETKLDCQRKKRNQPGITETNSNEGREERTAPNCLPLHVSQLMGLNLVTLTLTSMFLSRGLLNLYLYISQAGCDDDTILLYRLNSFPQLFLVVAYPLIVRKKLQKY